MSKALMPEKRCSNLAPQEHGHELHPDMDALRSLSAAKNLICTGGCSPGPHSQDIQSGTGREHCPPSSHLCSRTQHLTLFLSTTTTSLAVPNSPTLCLSQQPVHIHLEYFVNKSSKMNHTKQQHPSTAEAAHILNVLPACESWSPPMGGTSDRLVS